MTRLIVGHKSGASLLAVALMVGGWFVDQSSNIPVIDHLLFPAYHRALTGLATLESKKSLVDGDMGFGEIAPMIGQQITSPPSPIIQRIELTESNPSLVFGPEGAPKNVRARKFRIVLVTGQTGDLQMNDVEERLQSMRETPRTMWAWSLFWVGAVLQIALAFA